MRATIFSLLEVHPCHFTFPLSFVTCFCHFFHILMLSLDLSSLVSLFELSFSYLQDVLIWCARFLPYLYLPYHYHYLLIRVAYYLEHSPPFHLALPAIVTHRHQCILRYLHLVPSPLQMISSSDLYRHYRDTISTRPFTR